MKSYIACILALALLVTVLPAKHRTEVFLSGVQSDTRQHAMQKAISSLLSEINRAYFAKGKLQLAGLNIGQNTEKTLLEMWDSKSFYCPEYQIFQILIGRSDGLFEVRGIPIFYNRKSQELFEDELVLTLNHEGLIVDLRVALEKEQYQRMFDQVNTLQDKQLYEIVLNFVEDYRTAYNRKDINFIDKVFSDDALIIVGRIINTREALPDNLGLTKLSANKEVSYSRLNKTQYIRNLRSCFIKNSFVRIEFSDFRVQRHPIHDFVFGVQIHQKWRSSSYNDDGYLFLVIDLRDVSEPLVWVRTWQPEKSINPSEAFELGDFIIE